MDPRAKALYALIGDVRTAFRTFRALTDAMHEGLGPTTAMRAVLEHLHTNGPQSVPQIARAKLVSRQSIQTLVDALGDGGLVDLEPNPAHRRSSLVVLSREGAALFAAMREAENAALHRFAEHFDPAEIEEARATLGRLVALAEADLDELEKEGDRT